MKRTHIIAIIIIALAIGAMLGTLADSSTYASFKEVYENPDTEFHVVGQLSKSKELYYDPVTNVNHFSFYLIDNKGEERKVIFNGTKPQDFERSEQIVVTGKATGGDFAASKILMKCPSKYTDANNPEFKEVKAVI
jgi:cytochrome c-type biogenesis protein CcmE